MATIGYARLVEQLALRVRPLPAPAAVSGAVNRRVDAPDQILFPRGVAIDDSLVGHLEFALRHEGVNLELIDALFEHLPPADLARRLNAAPNAAAVRRAGFLWEWLTGQTLAVDATPRGTYVDLFPQDAYIAAAKPDKAAKFRVRNNALGSADFCPTVRSDALAASPSLAELLAEAQRTLETVSDRTLYERAIDYLYLSETRSSFAIEREKPSAGKQERFVQMLQRAGETSTVGEEWLVSLQNAAVRDVYSQEASYRTRQNWLEDGAGRITFLPPPPHELRRAMAGWEAFVNDRQRCPDALVKAACAAFGFVYLHPFMDGNGRIHRFLIHHVLTHSAPLPGGAVLPVSAVILKNILDYLDVLSGFSAPVTKLWDYVRGDLEPAITRSPGSRAYRFMDASREVAFLHRMVRLAVQDEIPRGIAWLSGYDSAFAHIDAEFDLPRQDLSALIRMIQSNDGTLSANRRKQYQHLPGAVLDRIETIVQEAFNAAGYGIGKKRLAWRQPASARRQRAHPADRQQHAQGTVMTTSQATPSITCVQTYLFFGGRCEEALDFYGAVLGAQVEMLMRYKDSPEPTPPGMLAPGFENKVMHACFHVGDTAIMASDGCQEGASFSGFSLSLSVPSEAEAERVFALLADGGTIQMPLAKTFWSPRFGMLTDRFGIAWMVNMPPEAAP